MATSVTYNGNSYSVPAYNDTGYAQGAGNVSSYLVALATGSLTLAGGSFPLTADANFGGSFGLVALYLKSVTANIASAGFIRMANADLVEWRNAANSGNNTLGVNGSNALVYNGVTLASSAGIVPVTSGGTGLASFTLGDLIYASAANTLAALAKDTNATRYLSNTGASNIPAWAQIALTTGVTGILPVANGGTNSSAALNNNRIVITGSSTIKEQSALTAGRTISTDSNGLPVTPKSGTVLQTVSALHNADVTSTSATYADTGLSCAITPLFSTSTIRVMAFHQHATANFNTGNVDIGIKLLRDASTIKTCGDVWGFTNNTATNGALRGGSVTVFDDAPGDTSAHTYKTQFNNVNAFSTAYIYDATGGNGVMILQEISA